MGHLEKALSIAAIATVVFGISFVKGAVKENEPEAAARGSRIFGGAGLALVLLATLLTWMRQRD